MAAGNTAAGNTAAALLRWRLVLGDLGAGTGGACASVGWGEAGDLVANDPRLATVDRALDFLYGDHGGERSAGLEDSMVYVPTWLGDIRRYFPQEVVAFMQKDAIEQRGLRQLLLEPETLRTLERDIGLVATILAFKGLMPPEALATAREVVEEIVAELRRKLEQQTRQALLGALRRDRHTPMKLARNLDMRRTVRESLRNYQPELGRVIPDRVFFYANQQRYHEWQIIVLVDQSGSMAESVVYAAIVGSVFASLRALDTRVVLFDTGIADVTDLVSDPVELLFGVQLGGGTDIANAVGYGAGLVQQPERTLFILITDLFEGGDAELLLDRLAALKESRTQVLCVLALNDGGRASFNHELARRVAALDIPAFAATPNKLVDAVERALRGESLGAV